MRTKIKLIRLDDKFFTNGILIKGDIPAGFFIWVKGVYRDWYKNGRCILEVAK